MRTETREVATGFGRALGGALLFSMPLLMTMEIWRLAVSVGPWKLVALAVATVLLTFGLARTFGAMRDGVSLPDAAVDTGVAVLAGALAATVVLLVLQIINPVGSWTAAASVVTIEALPASIGAAFARAQLGGQGARPSQSTYGHHLFLMAAGAVVFASNIAPTQEVVLLAATLEPGNAVLLVLLTLAVTHGFVYGIGFSRERPDAFRRSFVAYTVPAYAIALVLSAFMLWAFGRYDDTGVLASLVEAVVLALPASLGAAAARLVL